MYFESSVIFSLLLFLKEVVWFISGMIDIINPKSRLINPAKSETAIVSKEYIDSINKTIREKTNVNQWRNLMQQLRSFKLLKTSTLVYS